MFEIKLTCSLLIVQIAIYWMVKRRWPLLILPAMAFILLGIPNLFYTYEGIPTVENIKMNVVRMLLDSLYAVVLLIPVAFIFIKNAFIRFIIVALLFLTVPVSYAVSTKVYDLSSITYTVRFQYYTEAEPHVRFKFNFLHDRYTETDPPPRPDDSTRSLPSTTTQPSHA